MTCPVLRHARPRGSRWVLLTTLWFAALAPGCWLSAPEDPPPFDCAAIDRAEERFPDECGGDAGVAEDAGAQDGGDDAAPADDGGSADAGDGGP